MRGGRAQHHGGHAWPGSEFSKAIAAVVGRTTFSINANELMREFFEAHPIRD
jgi:poly(3-hydroxybutyrate) depolymerase